MARTGITWAPGHSPRDLNKGIDEYGKKVMVAVYTVAQYWAPILEQFAKAHKPWKNWTGHAQQSLFSVVDLSNDIVTIYLSHGMEYGIYLELCNSGRYAIIMPTLEIHYQKIKKMLDDIFRD